MSKFKKGDEVRICSLFHYDPDQAVLSIGDVGVVARVVTGAYDLIYCNFPGGAFETFQVPLFESQLELVKSPPTEEWGEHLREINLVSPLVSLLRHTRSPGQDVYTIRVDRSPEGWTPFEVEGIVVDHARAAEFYLKRETAKALAHAILESLGSEEEPTAPTELHQRSGAI